MTKDREFVKKIETLEDLQNEVESRLEKIRQMKRSESEINLSMAVEKMNTAEENIKEIMKACYDYIAQHRALIKKGNYGNHLE